MRKTPSISIEAWTERFLGTSQRGLELISLLESVDGGRWTPEKWGHFEPIKLKYSASAANEILDALSEERQGGISNQVFFTRKKPSLLAGVKAWRDAVPRLNRIWLKLDAAPFGGHDGATRLIQIAKELIDWSDAVYLSASDSRQFHDRMAQRTPQERLERMDWLTFFGPPYIDLFGGAERVLKAPAHSVEAHRKGVLILADERPDSPELTGSAERLLALEEYLGSGAFAGNGYPDVPCLTPRFDLRETVVVRI